MRDIAVTVGAERVYIDGIGWGAGVGHTLIGWGVPCTPVDVGEGSSASRAVQRSYATNFGGDAESFSKTVRVRNQKESPLRNKLAAELSSPVYGYTPAGKTKVEGKDEMKKRGRPLARTWLMLCV